MVKMKSTFASRTTQTRDTWETPIEIVRALGKFDLDPCASARHPQRCALKGYSTLGLDQPWRGRVWLNPPYGEETRTWLARLAKHGDGIALIPPRVGSHWFHDEVFSRCQGILFLRGRIAFIDPETQKPVSGNNADSILVAFGGRNVEALITSGLDGIVWDMREETP